uniref:Obscurin-like protein 1 n=1 Tax=Knipowitschia caucasica TaxID=637954 RepID=A0AAV2JX76_KNICA
MDVFGGAPRFLAYPRPVLVQSGADAVLKCQIGGDPRPAVIWERNNDTIKARGRYRVFEDGNVYNLIIAAVTVEDSGQYICKAKNSIGETYAAATLKVEGEAQEQELREENKPRFLIKPLSTRAGRGEDAVFSCKVWGNPKPDVVWEKDGKKLTEIFESTHFSVGSQDGGWFQLKIFKTRAPDGGVYTCTARNEFGEELAGAVLLVDAGPGHEDEGQRGNGYTNGQWKSGGGRGGGRSAPNRVGDTVTKTAKVKMFAVTEGKHAKFRCFVTGKPKPEIIWRKDGRLILSGRRYLLYEDREGYFTLKVLYCKQKDNGVYVCAASNTAGQTLSAVHLTVKEPPVRFKQPLIDLEVWERDLAVLECEVPEDSVPITWYLEDRRLQPGDKYGMEQWGTKRRLTIRDIGVDDDGIYLCELPDGGRSIAEVAVRGTILRKLPRKVDVLEGENAAFCVEVEKEEMEIHWYKDGVELKETHQTILKSFGRTHILVFVNTNPQDTGQVMFYVDRSKTSSQLRVKAARHSPPSAPVSVQINTERANAALLSWVPAGDCRKNPPSGYVLERQEVGTGSQEWLQCLTTDSARSVEILGDSVPCEADFRFRICSLNKYGKSANVEFPRTVHLVPVARIQAPLQDALVPEGQDAIFSIELTASVIGTWFLNGTQIQEDERFSTRRTRTHQSLRIRGVRDSDNGAEITFIAYGIRDSAALYIQAPLVKFSSLSEMDRNKFVEMGNPIVLYCELSDPAAPVHWYKNGVEIQTSEGLHIQSEGTMRRIVIQSAEFSHSGVYCCDAIDDVIRFNVEVEAPPVRFSSVAEADRARRVPCGRPLVLQCEVSEEGAQVQWLKDGSKVLPHSDLDLRSEGRLRTLLIPEAQTHHSGLYTCKTKGDSVSFSVDVTARPVLLTSLDTARALCVPLGLPVRLQCSVSEVGAPVQWFQDGMELGAQAGCQMWAEGSTRALCIPAAEMTHAGVYTCTTGDDSLDFTVDVQAIPAPTVFERTRSLEAVEPLELEYEVPDSAVSICWFKDNVSPLPPMRKHVIRNEPKVTEREIHVVSSAEILHSGLNRCETEDDATVPVSVHQKAEKTGPSVGPTSIVQQFEISDPVARARWYKDGTPIGAEIENLLDVRTPTAAPQDQERNWARETRSQEQRGSKEERLKTRTEKADQEHTSRSKNIEEDKLELERLELERLELERLELERLELERLELERLELERLELDRLELERLELERLELERLELERLELERLELERLELERLELERLELERLELERLELERLELERLELERLELERLELERLELERPELERLELERLELERLEAKAPERLLKKNKVNEKKRPYEEDKAESAEEQSLGDRWNRTREMRPGERSPEQEEKSTKEKNPGGPGLGAEGPEDVSEKEPLKQVSSSLLKSSVCSRRKPVTKHTEAEHSRQTVPSLLSSKAVSLKKPNYLLKTDTESVSNGVCRKVPLQLLEDSLWTDAADSAVTLTQHGTDRFSSAEEDFIYFTQLRQSLEDGRSAAVSAQSNMLQQTLIKPSVTEVLHPQNSPSAEACRSELHTVDSLHSGPGAHRHFPRGTDSGRGQTPLEQSGLTAQSSSVRWEERRPAAEEQMSIQTMADLNHVELRLSQNYENLLQTTETCRDLSDCSIQEFRTNNVQLKEPSSETALCSQLSEVQGRYSAPSGQTHPCSSHSVVSDNLRFARPNQNLWSGSQPSQLMSPQRTDLLQSDLLQRDTDGLFFSGQRLHAAADQIKPSKETYFSKSIGDHSGDRANPGSKAPVSLNALGETQRSCDAGQDIDLTCEVSDPRGTVTWSKDGALVCEGPDLKILCDGSMRSLSIAAAAPRHSGTYGCHTDSRCVVFEVEVKAPVLRFSALPEAELWKSVVQGRPLALQCELSHAHGQVTWYKDGAELLANSGVGVQSEGQRRSLYVASAQRQHCGVYRCESKDDHVQFTVDVREPTARAARFLELRDADRKQKVPEGSPLVLRCELGQDHAAEVTWSKDGEGVDPEAEVEVEGVVRQLRIQSASARHSGVYTCSTQHHQVQFQVDVKGDGAEGEESEGWDESLGLGRARLLPTTLSERHRLVRAGAPIVLQCQVSEVAAQVTWSKERVELFCRTGLDMKREGCVRKLLVHCAKPSDAGMYSCSLSGDVVTFIVAVQADMDTETAAPEVDAETAGPEQKEPSTVPFPQGSSRSLQEALSPQGPVPTRGPAFPSLFLTSLSSSSSPLSFSSPRFLLFLPLASSPLSLSLSPAAPPVTFMEIPEADLLKTVVEQEVLVLRCEVSAPAPEGEVQWYRDGAEVSCCERVEVQAEGTVRTLTLRPAELCDTGTYSCRTGDSVLIFKVTVRESPVSIVFPKEDVHLDRHVGEEVVLSCELSRPNGAVVWFKDGQKLQESENIKLKEEGPYRRLRLGSGRPEDSGEYVCDTDHDSIFFHINITEPPVRIVSPSQPQMELCQQTSERMVLSCEISRPNAVVRWYRDGLQVEESPNLLVEEDGVYRRLVIPKTSVQDSAEYVCDTSDDSMTFFVNIAEPPVRFLRPRKSVSKVEKEVGDCVLLECEVSRPNADVAWKRNGEEVEETRNVSIVEEGVTRQLLIHALREEEAGLYVCDAKDDLMDFTVTIKEAAVRFVGKPESRSEKTFVVGDDIILVCEVSRPNAVVTWCREGRPLEDSGRYCAEEQGVFRSLLVMCATREDQGEYSCEAGHDHMSFCVIVRDPPVQIVGNSGAPERHLLLSGEDLVLECEVSHGNAPVRWLKDGHQLSADTRVTIQSVDVVRKFVLTNLQPQDSGEYICDTGDDQMTTIVLVQEPPLSFLNKPPSASSHCALEGDNVSLSAELTRELESAQSVRWLKDDLMLVSGDNVHIGSFGAEQRLTLSSLQLTDSGEYVCDVGTDRMVFRLTVKETKVKFVRRLQSTVALRGHSLALQCEVNKASGDVQWLKDGQEVALCRRFIIRAVGTERSLTVHQVSQQDSGEYSCASTDDRTTATVTVEDPRVVEFVAGLRSVTVREGEDAVFKCVVSPEDVQLVWTMKGAPPTGGRVSVSCNGTCHTLRLSQCRAGDAGTVSANAEGVVSTAELQVQEPQVVFTRQMVPVSAEEYEEAVLEVEVDQEQGEVQWMRQGVLLHDGPKYRLLKRGRVHSLRVLGLGLGDAGRYSCETLHDRTQATLTVTPRQISIVKGLCEVRTVERETASLEVVVSHEDLTGTWSKNGTPLKNSAHYRISCNQRSHSLTIVQLSVEDTGTFTFSVQGLKTSGRLVVQEPPVTIIRKLEDQKFPEGAVISIECELSRHNVDVKWMKNGVEVKPSKSLRIYSLGRKRFLQVTKCGLSDSGVYTCDTGDNSTSCSVEVYERELLVLQELEDQEVEEEQNAVFMCELSVEDVSGEWFKKGLKIQQSSSIRTRHEGTKHFLLMCNVRPEDSGEIKFVARDVESTAFLDVEELPVSIVKPLQDQVAVERSRVLLDCTVSTPRCSCRWYRGLSVILPSDRFEICSEGCNRKLIIQQVALEDEGEYSVQVGEDSCSARLSVEAQSVTLVRHLSDLCVRSSEEACFEVEVSAPLTEAPVWTLEGEVLEPGPRVLVEKMGTVHRLTLRGSQGEGGGVGRGEGGGEVVFCCGEMRSSARLSICE